jgi:glycosyltransferase involved in cell wall biosynthesis
MPLISIVIPVYNEQKYIQKTLARLADLSISGWQKEIIIVDDGSTDGTRELLRDLKSDYKIIFQAKNGGKGLALRTGFAACQGEIIAIQDADWEYDPADLPPLIDLLISGQAQVVYGSRMHNKNPIGHYRYYLGNVLLSGLASLVYGCRLTDIETGYKVFKKDLLAGIELVQNDFGIEIELTAKFIKQGVKIIEQPIGYRPRRFYEGKKIGWCDGLKAIWLLFKYY